MNHIMSFIIIKIALDNSIDDEIDTSMYNFNISLRDCIMDEFRD